MARHEYGSEGSDRKHGAPRMLAKCTCGWQGPVLEGQGLKEREESVTQWAAHLGWNVKRNPKPIPDHSHDWDYWHDDVDDENGLCGTAPNHWAALRAIEEIENDR